MLNTEKHRMLMFQILKEIFESDIGKNIAFKGGTASYFLHNLDRFSTDLDFDLVQSKEFVDEKVINILKKYGEIKKGNKVILLYGDNETNIKIDINRNIWKSNKYELVDFFGTSIKVKEKSTIFANKLVALEERFTNRDIYDVYFFFQNLFDINEEIILERTGKNKKELFISIKDKLNKLPDNYKILDGLGELLTEKQKSFVKNKLVKELIGLLEMKINFGK